MNGILNIVLFIILLSVIVVVHEFGHLIAAKVFGIYCQEFSIGMGPKLFSKKGKETEYSIRAIPFGGFVAMAGDTDNELETKVDTTNIPHERTLPGVAKWKRIIIMLAGIIMNCLLALVIVAFVLLSVGRYSYSPDMTVGSVDYGSPAYEAGLRAGDVITYAEYEELGISASPKTFEDFITFVYGHDKDVLTITYVREGVEYKTSMQKAYIESLGVYQFGIGASEYRVVDITIANVIPCSIDYLAYALRSIFMALSQLLVGQGLNNLSGPVGVFQATSEAASQGAQSYLLMMALISLNVGIFNALPLPILDGGRVVILIIEAIIRKPLSEKVINILMGVSLLIVLALFVFATWQDLLRLFF